MACFHPLKAWRLPEGGTTLREPRLSGATFMRLPCGGCIGCRLARAREWALRCTLESGLHESSRWCTLTYDDDHLPPTLQKRDLSGFVKRVRARGERIRFFACGEYGERTARPHYHAILFGLRQESSVQSCWSKGFARVDPVTPAAISYVAGYCAKKVGWKLESGERVDFETGEVFDWQAPFLLMSRRPGIGGAARAFSSSWRRFAVHAGSPMPVPRFLHASWLSSASDVDVFLLESEKRRDALMRDSSRARLEAGELIAMARLGLDAAKRQKL
nr:MAG: replication initiator protein [Microvirus sp.]